MSYVDLMGTVRWTEQDHTNRSEAHVRAAVPHPREHILMRRLLSMILLAILPADNPLRAMCTVPTTEQLGEVVAAATAYAEAEALADAGRADAVLLNAALDHEEALWALAVLPPAPEPVTGEDGTTVLPEDPSAQERARLDAFIAAATPEVLALVERRRPALAPTEDPPADLAPIDPGVTA